MPIDFKTTRVLVRRKHTNTTFTIKNCEVIMDVVLDPYGGGVKLLALTRLTRGDCKALRNLLDGLLAEEN
jgi:hypothetical protein